MAKKRMYSRKRNSKKRYSRKTIKKYRRSKRQNTRKLNRHKKLRGGADSHEVGPRTDAEIMAEGESAAAVSTAPEDEILKPFVEEAEDKINSLKALLNETDEWAEKANKNPRPIPGRFKDRSKPSSADQVIEEWAARARAELDNAYITSDVLTKSEWRSGDRKVNQLQVKWKTIARPFD